MFESSGEAGPPSSADAAPCDVAAGAAAASLGRDSLRPGTSAPPLPAALAEMEPGVQLATYLVEYEPATVAEQADRVSLLKAWAKQVAWCEANLAAYTAVIAPQYDCEAATAAQLDQIDHIEDRNREEVAAALSLSPIAAQEEISTANELASTFPQLARAVEAGNINFTQARTVVRTVAEYPEVLTTGEAQQLEATVLPRIEGKPRARVREITKRVLHRIRPTTGLAEHERAREDRHVELRIEDCGMAVLTAYLPAIEAKMVFGVLDAKARIANEVERAAIADIRSAGDTPPARTLLGAHRADALIEIAAIAASDLTANQLPDAIWKVNVVLDLPTALGLANNPAEVSGLGPIPGPLARTLAADAQWTRWITDPVTGHLLDMGRRSYVPSDSLRDYIKARDQVCRFPGCHQPAARCDIDHAIPWDAGGLTNRDNLGALCRRHHRLKTHHNWRISESRADGSCVWISPSGQVYNVEPNAALMPWEQSDEDYSRSADSDQNSPDWPGIACPTVTSLGDPGREEGVDEDLEE